MSLGFSSTPGTPNSSQPPAVGGFYPTNPAPGTGPMPNQTAQQQLQQMATQTGFFTNTIPQPASAMPSPNQPTPDMGQLAQQQQQQNAFMTNLFTNTLQPGPIETQYTQSGMSPTDVYNQMASVLSGTPTPAPEPGFPGGPGLIPHAPVGVGPGPAPTPAPQPPLTGNFQPGRPALPSNLLQRPAPSPYNAGRNLSIRPAKPTPVAGPGRGPLTGNFQPRAPMVRGR